MSSRSRSRNVKGKLSAHFGYRLSGGEGGAHSSTICDGSYSTFALTHWGRDRPAGRIPVPALVYRLSCATALQPRVV